MANNRYKILVLDRNRDDAELTVAILENRGFDVTWSIDWHEWKDKIEKTSDHDKWPPDLIVLDVSFLTELNGENVGQKLSTIRGNKDIPFILTYTDDKELADFGGLIQLIKRQDIVTILDKPLDGDSLVSEVKKCFAKSTKSGMWKRALRRGAVGIVSLGLVILIIIQFFFFTGVESDPTLSPFEPGTRRYGTQGVEVQPICYDQYWSLVDYDTRSGSDLLLDRVKMLEIIAGAKIKLRPKLRLEVQDGQIVNTVNHRWIRRSENDLLNRYIEEVIQTFSGSYSDWADILLTLEINPNNGMIIVDRPDQFEPDPPPPNTGCRGCVPNRYFTNRPETLIGENGFSIQIRTE